jgi:hypothetical protein
MCTAFLVVFSRTARSCVFRKGESAIVSLIVGLRSLSLNVDDAASKQSGDSGHDLRLRASEASLDAGEVAVADVGGFGESAQAVAAFFALPSDFGSIGLHKGDSSRRQPTKQLDSHRKSWTVIGNRLLDP